jgi:3-methyladenine DNA glycosylase Mpg
VARDLLGAILVRRESDGITAGFIVEGEPYYGEADPASTPPRQDPAQCPDVRPGHAYVYLCAQSLHAERGDGAEALPAVLRALEPAAGSRDSRGRRRAVRH